ncbi:MAG: divergent polysaccharide deacetylase family protein [Desulfonauticus sp.]|nr:divergent polysaccharide deacetylase family protein [Desulfonauticus sp.]
MAKKKKNTNNSSKKRKSNSSPTSRKPKTKKRKNINNKRPFLKVQLTPVLIILATIALISVLAIFFSIHLLSPKTSTKYSSNISKPPKSNLKNIPQKSIQKKKYFQYEEKLVPTNKLEIKINQIDVLITNALYKKNKQTAKIILHQYKIKQLNNITYSEQTITLYTPFPHKFIQNLKELLKNSAPFAHIQKINSNTYFIFIDSILTHKITLQSQKITHHLLPKAKLAIVIDDIGRSIKKAKQLIELKLNITLSLLPYAPYTGKICQLAKTKNTDVMLHLPMEPLGYPQKANPGPGALFVNMPKQDLILTFLQDLNLVPNAIGVNNHMGSKFTAFRPGIQILFEQLKANNLFFLDSLTTPKTVTKALAKKINLPYLRRDIFLDNVHNKKAILYQLHKAEALALKKGKAIAIGHPYPETIATLYFWKNHRNKNVEVVKIKKFIDKL